MSSKQAKQTEKEIRRVHRQSAVGNQIGILFRDGVVGFLGRKKLDEVFWNGALRPFRIHGDQPIELVDSTDLAADAATYFRVDPGRPQLHDERIELGPMADECATAAARTAINHLGGYIYPYGLAGGDESLLALREWSHFFSGEIAFTAKGEPIIAKIKDDSVARSLKRSDIKVGGPEPLRLAVPDADKYDFPYRTNVLAQSRSHALGRFPPGANPYHPVTVKDVWASGAEGGQRVTDDETALAIARGWLLLRGDDERPPIVDDLVGNAQPDYDEARRELIKLHAGKGGEYDKSIRRWEIGGLDAAPTRLPPIRVRTPAPVSPVFSTLQSSTPDVGIPLPPVGPPELALFKQINHVYQPVVKSSDLAAGQIVPQSGQPTAGPVTRSVPTKHTAFISPGEITTTGQRLVPIALASTLAGREGIEIDPNQLARDARRFRVEREGVAAAETLLGAIQLSGVDNIVHVTASMYPAFVRHKAQLEAMNKDRERPIFFTFDEGLLD